MFEFFKTIYLSLDAPLWAVIGCPVGLVVALHFASDKNVDIKGARVDAVVREARLAHNAGRSWLKSAGFFLAFGYSMACFAYVFDPNFVLDLIDRLPS
jgi:hypothetical protein